MKLPALLVTLALLAGCAAGKAPSPAPMSPAPTVTLGSPAASARASGAGVPGQATARPPLPSECAASMVRKMTAAERAGQLVMVGITSASAAELSLLRRLRIGSVILMGTHTDGVSGVKKVTAKLTWTGQRTPLLVAVDQEGGLVQRLKGPGFDTIASARRQGTWSDAKLGSRAARWGRQLASAGVNWTLAPVADVVPASMVSRNAPIGRLDRGYGSDPGEVAAKITAYIDGMQSSGVATSAKHFPGIGRVVGNTDFTANVKDTVTTQRDAFLEPFRAAVEAGTHSVMMSTVTYTRIDPDHPAVFSAPVIRLLRARLGLDGVIISDDLGAARSMAAVPARKRAIRFVRAGGDLAITVDPRLADEFVDGIVAAAKSSDAVADLVTQAAVRVVALKVKLGLVPCR